MKVKGSGSTSKTTKAAPARQSGDRNATVEKFEGLLEAHGAEGGSASAAAGSASAIAGLDALLMAQETDDPAQRQAKQRMQRRANKVLDALEAIRSKMLQSNLTVGDLINVADVVASHREKINDPHLTALMDEVDLRAQVEIAKMRVAMDRNAQK